MDASALVVAVALDDADADADAVALVVGAGAAVVAHPLRTSPAARTAAAIHPVRVRTVDLVGEADVDGNVVSVMIMTVGRAVSATLCAVYALPMPANLAPNGLLP